MEVQRVSTELYSFINLALDGGGVVNAKPRSLYGHGKNRNPL